MSLKNLITGRKVIILTIYKFLITINLIAGEAGNSQIINEAKKSIKFCLQDKKGEHQMFIQLILTSLLSQLKSQPKKD